MPLLPCVEIEPTEPHRATVLWLHGLGASGHDFEPIVPALRMPWARFVFPHAPVRPVTINGGYRMPSWYDIRSLDFDATDREDPGELADSAAAVEALLAREEARVAPGKVVLAGFSQGGALALYVGRRHAQPLAGILVLSAYRVEPEAAPNPANAATPLMFAHGRYDDVVPMAAGRAACAAMQAEGRPVVWKDYPMAHEVCPEQIGDVRAWLRDRLA